MKKQKISPPWVTFYKEMDALFGEDPEIEVKYDAASYTVALYVDNPEKADALTVLLPEEKVFGNVTVKIKVLPANKLTVNVTLFQKAFEGNPAFAFVKTAGTPFFDSFRYVVFKNRVVQFFNDDIRSVYGVKSTLYEDIARDVFADFDGIFFCTDTEEKEK